MIKKNNQFFNKLNFTKFNFNKNLYNLHNLHNLIILALFTLFKLLSLGCLIIMLLCCPFGCSSNNSYNKSHYYNKRSYWNKYQNNNKINRKSSNLSNVPGTSNVKVVWSRKLGNMYTQKQDHGPHDIRDIPDLSSIPDVVPKYEPKSRYGNPPKYKVFNKTYKVLSSSKGYKERGNASWYGTKFHGFRTSSGEIYDMYKLTAAHKTLPLPTYVKVVNLHNKRSIIVKVNDRGPFHGDRILDLSYAAASKLGIVNHGVGKVEIMAINPISQARSDLRINQLPEITLEPENLKEPYQPKVPNERYKTLRISHNNFSKKYLSKSNFQLGAFSVKSNATKLASKLETLLKNHNLLKDKHYKINIFEDDLSESNKNNILYKVIISVNKGDHNFDYQKFKNILLNLSNNNLAINI